MKPSRLPGSGCHPLVLAAAVAAWLATAGNLALWGDLARLSALDGPGGLLFGAALAGMIFAVLLIVIGVFAWRWTLKPVLVLLLLAGAFGAHFMLAYHVVIDAAMLTNVLQTDRHEARDLASLRLVLTVGVLGVVPAWLVWRMPLREPAWPRRLAGNGLLIGGSALLLGLLVFTAFQPLASTSRNHKALRYTVNPLNSLYALGRLAVAPLEHPRGAPLAIGEDARLAPAGAAGAKPPLVLLVVGETARAGNFALNGYPRPTTPELAALGVASFRNVWSCGTSTAASLPCMFSHLGQRGYEARDRDFEGLLDVLQRAGLAVLWLDNQAGCKGVCERVPHAATDALDGNPLCDDGECFDEVMLQGLDMRIAALPAAARARGVVVLLHQMGGHGPAYARRSPPEFKRFEPECTSHALQDCSRDQLVNAYDNSIVYTDHFLAESIRWLRAREATNDAALVYVADHGESLGENNLYLHGLPYAIAPDEQKRVPWITWLGAGFERRSGLDIGCLNSGADAPLSHDHYFHSVLGLLGVQTQVYDARLDAYAGCRNG